jgi:hypothetical protein
MNLKNEPPMVLKCPLWAMAAGEFSIGFTRPFGLSLFPSTRGTVSFHHASQKYQNDASIGPIMPPSSIRQRADLS